MKKVKVRRVVISVSLNRLKFSEFFDTFKHIQLRLKFIRLHVTVKKQSAYIRVGVIFVLQENLIFANTFVWIAFISEISKE